MSWDIIVQNIPIEWQSLDDIPGDWQPSPIGSREEIIQKIIEVIPFADFSDPSWGHIRTSDCSIEVSLGKEKEVIGFALHVRGGDSAIDILADMLDHLRLRAFDGNTPGGFFDRTKSKSSLGQWRNYRDHVLKIVQSESNS